MKYYVYEWIRSDNNTPFYVGKGSGNRAGHKKSNKGWINITSKTDCYWRIIERFNSEEEAYLFEHQLIKSYREKDIELVNQTEYSRGGSSWSYTDEVRERQSINRKGKSIGIRSKEWGNNISKSLMGRDIKWKSSISKALKGKPKNYISSRRKIIQQYDYNMILINTFESASHAGIHLEKSGNSIADCAAGRQKTAYGYIWKYK